MKQGIYELGNVTISGAPNGISTIECNDCGYETEYELKDIQCKCGKTLIKYVDKE